MYLETICDNKTDLNLHSSLLSKFHFVISFFIKIFKEEDLDPALFIKTSIFLYLPAIFLIRLFISFSFVRLHLNA